MLGIVPRRRGLCLFAGSMLVALQTNAQTPPQCVSLAGSTSCPAFQDQYVSPSALVYAYDFFNNVTDRVSFDIALWNYVYGSYATVKYGEDLGCTNFDPTTEYSRWTLTYLCGVFTQNTLSDSCNSQHNVTPKMLCQATCTQFADSESAIVSNYSICGSDQSGGSRQYWLTEDHNSCTDWTSLATADTTSTTCISGSQNEGNCGFGTATDSLCSFCDPSRGSVDPCCSSSNTTLTQCSYAVVGSSATATGAAAAQASALSVIRASASISGLGGLSSAVSAYASTASGSVVSGPNGLTTLTPSGSSTARISMTLSSGPAAASSSNSGTGGAGAMTGTGGAGPTSASDSSNNFVPSGNGLSGGAIAGIVIGSLVGAAIICVLLFLLCRRRSGSIFSGSSRGSQQSLLQGSTPQGGSPHPNTYAAEAAHGAGAGAGSGAGTGPGASTGSGGASGAGHGGEYAGAAAAGAAAAGIGAAAAGKRPGTSGSTANKDPAMSQTNNRMLAGSRPTTAGGSRPGTAGGAGAGSSVAGAASNATVTSPKSGNAEGGAAAAGAGAAAAGGAAAIAAGHSDGSAKGNGSAAGSSSMAGSGASSSNVISSYQDQYSPYAITPHSTVVAVYPYSASLADELTLEPDSIVFVRRMYDDGWAVGSIEDTSAPGGKRDGAFPLVCVTSKAGYDEQATGTSEGGQSSMNDSGTLGGHTPGRDASGSQGTDSGASKGNPHGWAGYNTSADGSGYFGGARTNTTTTDDGRSLHTADEASRSNSRMSEDPSFQSFDESENSLSSSDVPARGVSMRRRQQ